MRAAVLARSHHMKNKSFQREAGNAHQNVRLIMTGAILSYGQSDGCPMHQRGLSYAAGNHHA
jgi:hypothetical protein